MMFTEGNLTKRDLFAAMGATRSDEMMNKHQYEEWGAEARGKDDFKPRNPIHVLNSIPAEEIAPWDDYFDAGAKCTLPNWPATRLRMDKGKLKVITPLCIYDAEKPHILNGAKQDAPLSLRFSVCALFLTVLLIIVALVVL